ncbi:MAG: hypothetical protein AAF399_20390, partial [Bacteroidota bacterium]
QEDIYFYRTANRYRASVVWRHEISRNRQPARDAHLGSKGGSRDAPACFRRASVSTEGRIAIALRLLGGMRFPETGSPLGMRTSVAKALDNSPQQAHRDCHLQLTYPKELGHLPYPRILRFGDEKHDLADQGMAEPLSD